MLASLEEALRSGSGAGYGRRSGSYWKRGPARYAELRKRGVGTILAAQTAGSAHSRWRLANSPALALALPDAYFDSLGIPLLTGRR